MKPFGLKQENRIIIDLRPYRMAEWDTAYINDLPDSAFAYIAPGGSKDADGKTTPRSNRKLPYKDKNGNVDLPHLRNALSRLPQSDIPDADQTKIKTTLQNALDKANKQGDDATNQDGMDDVSEAPTSIEIITVGVWDTPWHGAFAITSDDLREMIANNDAGLRNGLPIDYEHDEDGGAAGWITNLRIAPSSADPMIDALWGDVEWTPQAAQAIKDGVYRYFSPEFYPEDYCDPMDVDAEYDNVLIGGGLTNRPLMRNLAPVTANDGVKVDKKVLTANTKSHTIYVRKSNENMNLKDLLEKAPADLTDEEKAFIVENKADLTDEQVTSLTDAGVLEADGGSGDGDGDGGDGSGSGDGDGDGSGDGSGDGDGAGDGAGDGDGTQASEKGKVVMTEAEARVLRKQAAEGAKAMSILERKQAHEEMGKIVFNEKTGGKFPVTAHDKLTDFYLSLDDSQRKAFNEIVKVMPDAAKLFSTVGSNEPADGSAVKQFGALIDEKMKANDKLTYVQAMRIVAKENPTLSEQYNKEIEGR